MGYRLAPAVSFGLDGDGAVVLDLERDLYRRIGPGLTGALLSVGRLDAECENTLWLAKLVAAGILLADVPSARPRPAAPLRPITSALETASVADGMSPASTSVVATLLSSDVALRTLGLHRTIRWTRARRATLSLKADPERAIAMAQSFARGRIVSPFGQSCVPSGLALSHLLARAGVAHDLVFGVRMIPFSAHAWVQAETCALSDSAGFVGLHLPVFVL